MLHYLIRVSGTLQRPGDRLSRLKVVGGNKADSNGPIMWFVTTEFYSQRGGAELHLRLRVCRLVALESVAQVVLVVHVALGAQVVVKAHFALPSHTHDAVLLAAVTDDVGVTHSCVGRRLKKKKKVSGGLQSCSMVARLF